MFSVACLKNKKIKSAYDTKFFQTDFGPYISLTTNCLLSKCLPKLNFGHPQNIEYFMESAGVRYLRLSC